jgi:hypothetical protein
LYFVYFVVKVWGSWNSTLRKQTQACATRGAGRQNDGSVFCPATKRPGDKPCGTASRKELNFAPVAPTSAHTESIFSVVFEIWLMRKL